MKYKQPLNDTWMFWNAERLDEYPHVSANELACATADDDQEDGEQESSRLAGLELFLLYVGGVSAAMVGMGLVVLIGSFISAYSALNGPAASEQATAPAHPSLSLQHPAPSAKASLPEAIVLEPARSGTAPRGEMSPTRGAGYPRAPSGI